MKSRVIATALLALAGLTVTAPQVVAEETRFEVKAADTIRDILTQRMGKRVILRLDSGENLEGTLTMVGNSLVHLSKLAGRDYYDAAVSIDRISAVLVQVRGR